MHYYYDSEHSQGFLTKKKAYREKSYVYFEKIPWKNT